MYQQFWLPACLRLCFRRCAADAWEHEVCHNSDALITMPIATGQRCCTHFHELRAGACRLAAKPEIDSCRLILQLNASFAQLPFQP